MAGRVLVCVGVFLLLHAAFSATQHRSFVKLAARPFTSLPLDVVLQCLIGFAISCVGVVRVTVCFREIKTTSEAIFRTFDTVANCRSFYSFRHRGRALLGTEHARRDRSSPVMRTVPIAEVGDK
jgi:hypothetical protein